MIPAFEVVLETSTTARLSTEEVTAFNPREVPAIAPAQPYSLAYVAPRIPTDGGKLPPDDGQPTEAHTCKVNQYHLVSCGMLFFDMASMASLMASYLASVEPRK